MAAMDIDESPFSLLSLEDELSCSICLCPFECPVTIPCGHNFCQDCLLASWKDSYSCPQCRTLFATKPELKKNTVLSTVVETFKMKSTRSELHGEEVKAEKKPTICCDTCMQAEASQTCLTCMASFCEEHLKPHRENPNFRLHQLSEPLADLSERICPDHHKLMELFCVQHGRAICSFCLQQVHKGCSFMTPEEQKGLKQTDFRSKLGLLDEKIEKNKNVISQMMNKQDMLKDSATNRKKALAAEYQQMRDMLDREEREALTTVDREQESSQTKLKGLMKKFTDNIEKMSKAKDDINNLLGQSQSMAFLQASVDLPSVVAFDPYIPKSNMDSKTVTAAQAFAAVLKEHLTEVLKQPVEARLRMLKPEMPPGPPRPQRSHSPGAALRAGQKKKPAKSDKKSGNSEQTHQDQRPDKQTRKPTENMKAANSMDNLLDMPRGRPPAEEAKGKPETPDIPLNITSAAKRNDLLKYGTVLTLDPKTAHKRVILSEDLTNASVSDEPTNYPDAPARFSVCSQVLTSKGFSRGRHYWEIKMSSNNFIGLGLAYNSIDRKGPASRLGRNAQSWCVEWFNVKLSAWHASSETVLVNPNPKRVGVLLDCEEGTATFYNVADRAYPFHSFVFPFAEAVYPAFWIFSSGSSISLCKLQA
ncbi:E3 ubiquitin/ISG15 ligase TRIM25 isoform X2 [Centroberyx gerrardi]